MKGEQKETNNLEGEEGKKSLEKKKKIWNRKKKKNITKKERRKKEKVEPSSLPSLCERSETPGALDRRALMSRSKISSWKKHKECV